MNRNNHRFVAKDVNPFLLESKENRTMETLEEERIKKRSERAQRKSHSAVWM